MEHRLELCLRQKRPSFAGQVHTNNGDPKGQRGRQNKKPKKNAVVRTQREGWRCRCDATDHDYKQSKIPERERKHARDDYLSAGGSPLRISRSDAGATCRA